ncbi:MAG: LysR family transcriptional regulator [Pseudomonadota bacterium]
MNFTLDQLRAFLEISHAGGVRKAAERLNITQPAVTARLKALEDTLGTELFDRSAGMMLTKSGDALLGYAEQYLELGSLIERDVAGPESFAGLFRLGVSETIVQSWLPEFVRSLGTAYPKLSVEIDVDISLALRDRLLENKIDVALLMGPVSDFRVENVPLPEFRLSWFRSREAEVWNPADGASVITFARDTRPFRSMKQALLERYGPDVAVFPSSSLSACFRLVAAGLGVGALPAALATPYVERGEIEEFDLGWTPEALSFTASFLAGPGSVLRREAALLAQEAAERAAR